MCNKTLLDLFEFTYLRLISIMSVGDVFATLSMAATRSWPCWSTAQYLLCIQSLGHCPRHTRTSLHIPALKSRSHEDRRLQHRRLSFLPYTEPLVWSQSGARAASATPILRHAKTAGGR